MKYERLLLSIKYKHICGSLLPLYDISLPNKVENQKRPF